MTKRTNCVGPCATACKPGAGTDAQNGTFDRILVAATEHAAREAGLPGRVDRDDLLPLLRLRDDEPTASAPTAPRRSGSSGRMPWRSGAASTGCGTSTISR
jgi:hypothetical protein